MSSELADNLEHPLGPYLYTLSCLHCTPVSLADGGEGKATWASSRPGASSPRRASATSKCAKVPADILGSYFIASVG